MHNARAQQCGLFSSTFLFFTDGFTPNLKEALMDTLCGTGQDPSLGRCVADAIVNSPFFIINALLHDI
ncbi:hypothetical protein CH063_04333 [Colletotrichum higginsianum]|uniref:Uncharacterized protein n=1 Tax=Colletotrichum higginsianum (strain IMI 349063) TaxID=759273 RepID=H1UUW7_COLHI|nr:hypothetical protein CH063_04333 [Colletotrichum higginsianum]